MATPNYGYEKRQKELAKKRKKEDKLKAKAERKAAQGTAGGSPDPLTNANEESAQDLSPVPPVSASS